MTWTATSNNMISNFDYAAGDYSSWESISITVSDLTNAAGIRLQIRANGKEKLVVLDGEKTFTKYLIKDFGFTESDLTSVEWVRVLGCNYGSIDAEHPASAVINDVYFYQPSKTLNVNLSAMASSSGNATWNKETKVFAWTLNYSNSIVLPGLSGNLSSYSTINYETAAGTSEAFRILIYYNNGAAQTTYAASVGKKSVTFAEMGVSEENLAHINTINFAGASTASGDVILNSFSLEGPALNRIEDVTTQVPPVGGQDINGMTGAGSIKWDVTYPTTLGTGAGWCGDIDSDSKNVDIADKDYLHFVVSNASADAHLGLRVFVVTKTYNPDTEDKNKYRVCLYPHPIAEAGDVSDWTAVSYITSPGVYVVKISDYPLLRGFKTNNSWDNENSHRGTITVSLAYVTSGDPANPVDNIDRVGDEALTDPHAICFDVTKLEGTGLTLNATNSNALFIANDGELTNTKNVIVNGTCASLELTDGNYPFGAPVDFTATSASYNRTFKAGTRSTVCLPFALTAAEAAAAGTFYELSGTNLEGTELTFEAVSGGTTAYKPYIFEANADGTPFSTYSSKAIGTTPATCTGTTVEGYTLTGVLTGSSDVAADNEGKTVYGWSGNSGQEGTFVKVGTGVAIDPFRAYVVYDGAGSSPARMSARFVGGFVTGVKEVSKVQNFLNPDGKFVENGKIVIIKNGVKYNATGAQIK
ncbi:MAG: hypothetical protein IKO58_04885 [Prevotella sp.]|nr:hypothetical protein [Prevotella sp.]